MWTTISTAPPTACVSRKSRFFFKFFFRILLYSFCFFLIISRYGFRNQCILSSMQICGIFFSSKCVFFLNVFLSKIAVGTILCPNIISYSIGFQDIPYNSVDFQVIEHRHSEADTILIYSKSQ